MAKPIKSTSGTEIVASTMCRVAAGELQNAWGVVFTAVASATNAKEGMGNGCILVATIDDEDAAAMIDCGRAIKYVAKK